MRRLFGSLASVNVSFGSLKRVHEIVMRWFTETIGCHLRTRGRSNLIAVAIDFWQLQFFEIALLIANWVAIAIEIVVPARQALKYTLR